MDKKFSLKKIPFYNLKKIEDKCPTFTIVTSLEKYPEIIQELENLQKLLKTENIFYQNKFYLEVKKSENKKPIGWNKFLKIHLKKILILNSKLIILEFLVEQRKNILVLN